MLAKAVCKYVRLSPQKTRLVIELIKGKTVEKAKAILMSTKHGSCHYCLKALNSAFSNVNFAREEKLLEKDVFISKITADSGPTIKRFRAATMGRATPILHRTAHIRIELDATRVEAVKPAAKTKKSK
ncbi:MAG: 50S ribosomal protein L22 [Candidatus Omnitrophica bacterium]|nr:50S ribosomal protein L22 [Candidatus Omnitrophota bacterium]